MKPAPWIHPPGAVISQSGPAKPQKQTPGDHGVGSSLFKYFASSTRISAIRSLLFSIVTLAATTNAIGRNRRASDKAAYV